MQTAALKKPGVANPILAAVRMEIEIGDRVRLLSGELAGVEGVVLRHEGRNAYMIAVPDANSGLLIRVQKRRFRKVPAKLAS